MCTIAPSAQYEHRIRTQDISVGQHACARAPRCTQTVLSRCHALVLLHFFLLLLLHIIGRFPRP